MATFQDKPQKKEQVIELKIMGQKVVLKSQGDPETIREVADLVALRLKDAERRTKGMAAHQVALLALMDLAEEYVKAKKRTQEHKKKIEKRSGDLSRLMDLQLK